MVSPVAMLRVIEPAKYAGLTQKVLPDALPEHVRIRVPLEGPPGRFSDKLHKERQPIKIEILISDVPPGTGGIHDPEPPLQKVDGWQMRDDLLRLERSTASLLGFLNHYGEWGEHTSPTFSADAEAVKMEAKIVLPDEIWYVEDAREPDTSMKGLLRPRSWLHIQDAIRWGLNCRSTAWFRSGYCSTSPEGPRPEFPHFVITAMTCYDVILTTITVDRLLGTKFRICARPDCGVPFALESRHKRNYCCQYCAHLQSVRRNRHKR